MKVIFTAPMLKYPAAGGPFLRMENSVKALHAISELHIISRVKNNMLGGNIAEDFYKKYSTNFIYAPSVDDSFFNKLKRKIKFWNYKYFQKGRERFFEVDIDTDFILHYAAREKIDVIWCGYGCVSFDLVALLKLKAKHLKIVYDTDSVHSRFILRELEFELSEERRRKIEKDGRKQQQEEVININLCDVATAVSSIDADYYKKLAIVPEKVHLFSNVIDLNNYNITYAKPDDIPNGKIIYLAGYFGPKSPMNFAAHWFIDNVFPLLIKEHNVYLMIIGSGADDTLKDIKHERIIIKGQQKTLLPYLKNADVAIVPLWFESGTRFKIIEAAACKIPIVSTSLGAEGLMVENGKHLFIADTPEAFASAIINVFNDKEGTSNKIEACRKFVEEFHTLNALVVEGKKILSYFEVCKKL